MLCLFIGLIGLIPVYLVLGAVVARALAAGIRAWLPAFEAPTGRPLRWRLPQTTAGALSASCHALVYALSAVWLVGVATAQMLAMERNLAPLRGVERVALDGTVIRDEPALPAPPEPRLGVGGLTAGSLLLGAVGVAGIAAAARRNVWVVEVTAAGVRVERPLRAPLERGWAEIRGVRVEVDGVELLTERGADWIAAPTAPPSALVVVGEAIERGGRGA